MSEIEAIILGIVQGLTEFLPVSSSGHIELGKALLNTDIENNMLFSLIVHCATVLSIFIVFWKDIAELLKSLFTFKWNENNQYIAKILLSIIPLGFIYFLLKDPLEALFEGRLVLVGCMLICTSFILLLSRLERKNNSPLTFGKSLIIGVAQAVAVLPGISRSGTTIATALALGIKREEAARFSFLMVLLPIIGGTILELKDISEATGPVQIDWLPLGLGFLAAFISGLLACRLMLKIVNNGKIWWFSVYCFLVGCLTVALAVM